MRTDPDFMVHLLYEAWRSGVAEEMEATIGELLLAVRNGDLVIDVPQELEEDYGLTADGLSIRDESIFEDLEVEWDADTLDKTDNICYLDFTDTESDEENV